MGKQSAGLLLYRRKNGAVEVLLIHPGGPFWAKKDNGAWSLPKGEFEGDDGLAAAKREFQEELGQAAPEADYRELGTIKNKSGKVIYAWTAEGDLDVSAIRSNTFSIEWPPKSGQQQEFPEADRAGWFSLNVALQKLHGFQPVFVERLAESLGMQMQKPEQTTLF